jgi:hypothetical protein
MYALLADKPRVAGISPRPRLRPRRKEPARPGPPTALSARGDDNVRSPGGQAPVPGSDPQPRCPPTETTMYALLADKTQSPEIAPDRAVRPHRRQCTLSWRTSPASPELVPDRASAHGGKRPLPDPQPRYPPAGMPPPVPGSNPRPGCPPTEMTMSALLADRPPSRALTPRPRRPPTEMTMYALLADKPRVAGISPRPRLRPRRKEAARPGPPTALSARGDAPRPGL